MSIATYATRGRYAFWVAASANMYLELTDDDDDYLNDALSIAGWGLATGALLVPEVGSTIVGWGLTRTAQGIGWAAAGVGRHIVAPAAVAVAPIAAGAAIGAVAGTAVAGAIWGEEGAQTAMGFYSAGLLPGTEAPDLTDYQYIFKPTAPGGPVSAYDVAKKGAEITVLTGRKATRKFWKTFKRLSWKKPWMM